MKRFIDLRDQGTGYRFAWWDTVVDVFERHGVMQDMAWDTWQEFATDYIGDDFVRYERLMPEWTKQDSEARESKDPSTPPSTSPPSP